ncbi:MAG: class I SAM-dependent methyltransferase [Gammaproteobacteria bacterium]|nr:class I SAM-dependent methyltransferase [Gammaproteobacteria bacterium]MBU1654294.1 class I SAM-dependent methyltransferase [Gammaproteobacteria bacterium]MBU1961231.1 class I SAM-dependent methyltransferase [Gammaproteobacteria bacterium]
MNQPEAYEAWYQTERGNWIAGREFDLMRGVMGLRPGASLLDVGCGTGHFSRRFADWGLEVTGIDPDPITLDFARTQAGGVRYIRGTALNLPFPDHAFDYAIAVTSLCFIADPVAALREMWRVSRRGLVLGLLNRRSLLHRLKRDRGGYRGARWDEAWEIEKHWLTALDPAPAETRLASALFLPLGNRWIPLIEDWVPQRILGGGFLAVSLRKPA